VSSLVTASVACSHAEKRCQRRRPPRRQRFNREPDLAASLYHEHIVGIHDRGEYEGQLWISMDYVEGTDAAKLLRTQYPSGMPKTPFSTANGHARQ
jgi:serine/threonine protein kinase